MIALRTTMSGLVTKRPTYLILIDSFFCMGVDIFAYDGKINVRVIYHKWTTITSDSTDSIVAVFCRLYK